LAFGSLRNPQWVQNGNTVPHVEQKRCPAELDFLQTGHSMQQFAHSERNVKRPATIHEQ
jgi:hypothetical protein